MTNVYFHEDLSSWSSSVAVKEAIREVRATSDLTQRNASTRRAGDDQVRRAELSLGEILFHFPAAILEVATATNLTTGALRERRDVYAASVEAGAMDELLAMTLSYTNHRGLVGIRVKSVSPSTIEQRIAAAHESIERNGGTFKEDDEFFDAIGALPPPNNFNRIVTNLERDPEYADEKLDEVYDRLHEVMFGYLRRMPPAERARRRKRRGGTITEPSVEELIGIIASRVTSNLTWLIDTCQEQGVPIGVLMESENWDAKIRALREISAREPVG